MSEYPSAKLEEVTHHLVEGESWNIGVRAVGEKTPAGVYARYDIYGFNTLHNPYNKNHEGYESVQTTLPIVFMSERPIPGDLKGVTMESLLAVCKHRLEAFQAGQYPCYENGEALKGIDKALNALKSRTLRQVEIAKAQAERGEPPTPVA